MAFIPPSADLALSRAGSPPISPEMPSLNAYPMPMEGEEEETDREGQVGALPRLFFGLNSALDTLARAIPGSAEDIDDIKSRLHMLMVKAIRARGANTKGRPASAVPSGMY